jgi:hypothetical protein
MDHEVVFTYGKERATVLSSVIKRHVVNLQDLGCPPLNVLKIDDEGINTQTVVELLATWCRGNRSSIDLTKFEARLKTFKSFPHDNVRFEDFAKTGLYYTFEFDRTVCVFCHIVLEEWVKDDSPTEQHKRWNNSWSANLLLLRIMNSLEILNSLASDMFCKKEYYGVCAADTLPSVLNWPSLLVANTDVQNLPGSHWVAFHVDSRGHCEFFDSFGNQPLIAEHRRFLDQTCKSWSHNNMSLQGFTSTVCGHYCVMFLAYKARGLSTESFLSLFESNQPSFNDKLVDQIYLNHFGKCTKVNINSSIVNQCCCAMYK